MKKRKYLALLLTFAMVIGMMPSFAIAASAEESHTHTESCYAQAGDLLCDIPESEGHVHSEDCYCPGGEYICGQIESEGHVHDESCYEYDDENASPSNASSPKLICGEEESAGHTHTEECVCPGGELICGKDESEGHTHGEDCYAKGGELICTADKENMLPPVATVNVESSEAAIGETNYDTLQKAIDSAQDGDTILIMRDINLTKDTLVTIAPNSSKEITIDLNQKTINYPNDDEWDDIAALTISKPITLNIKNGKIDVGNQDHSAIKIACAEETPVDLTLSGVTIQAGHAAIYTDNETGKDKITLENVDITSDKYGVNASNADITFKSGSIHTTNDETFSLSCCSLTIDDGEFITTDDTCMDLWNEDIVVINGGYFKSGDDNALYLSDDSKATINGGVFEAPDKAICTDATNVTLGENLKATLQDGTTLEDYLNSTYVRVVKITVTVTFINDGQKVAEVLVRNGQNISGDDLTDQSMPADPIKGGYKFKGWWTGQDGTGEAFTDTSIVTNDLTVYAKMDEDGGSLTITKKVVGTGMPDKNTEFEFTVTQNGNPASGQYSINGGAEQPIPADGKIKLKADESAVLTGLELGEYVVTETAPTQANYKSTSFSVNNGEVQNGLSATVTVTAASVGKTGGWKKENGTLVKDEDGYFTYTITSDQIDADGNITVDCDALAEYMEAQMRDSMNWSSCNFKVKFVNETGSPIQYKDYSFDTVNWLPVGDTYVPSTNPSMLNTNEGAGSYSAGYGWGEVWQQIYPMLIGQKLTTATLNATGFDGKQIRVAIAPLRCINPAVVSYFKSNPGNGTLTGNSNTNSAQTITLLQMNALPELIKQAFTFENCEGTEISLTADDSRTYADFICAFYGVQSLNELTVAQKYNVFGTGYKGSPAMPYAGQSHITTYYANTAGNMANWCIPYAVLNDGTLDYFKTWGFSDTRIEEGKKLQSGGQIFSADDAALYAYQPDYYLMETDPEVLSMAYEYLYDRCIRFTLDADDRPISTAIDNSATSNDSVGGIKDYMNRTDAATANVLKTMNNGAAIEEGDSITLDNVKGYIEVPNAWNQFRYYDFGFQLIFESKGEKPAPASVAFTNTYEKNDTPEPSVPGEKVGNLTVSKTISGNGASSTKAFTFTVTLTDKNGQAVSGTFGDAVFDKNGQHIFTLKAGENKAISSIPAGTKYAVAESDNSGYTVTVNNTADVAATGTIMAGETAVAAFNNYKSGGGGGETSDPSPAKVNLTATKTLDGKAPSGSAFSFVLKDKDGNIVQTKNNQEGSIAFDSLSFSAAGTYTYYIAEQAGTDANINYDATSYKVTITVTRSGDYKAAVNYEKNGQAYDGIPVFVNTTKADDSDKPNTPTTPDKPTKPTDPDTPDEPNKPTKPTDPAQPIDPVPQTGDETDIGMWLTLMLCSFVALVGVCVYERKRRYSGRHVRR